MADIAILPKRLQVKAFQVYRHRIDQILHEARRIMRYTVANNSQENFIRSMRPIRSAYRDLIKKKEDIYDEVVTSRDLSQLDKTKLLVQLRGTTWKMSKLWQKEADHFLKVFKAIK